MRHLPSVAKICVAVAGLMLAIGIGDFAISLQDVPAQPAPCPVSGSLGVPTDACDRAVQDQAVARSDRIDQITRGFNDRERLYGVAAALALLLAVVSASPAERTARRRFFATVGSAGVALLVITTALYAWAFQTELSQAGDVIAFLPAFMLLAIAAFGGLSTATSASRRTPLPTLAPSSRGESAVSAAHGPEPPPHSEPVTVSATGPQSSDNSRGGAMVDKLPWIGLGFTALMTIFLSAWVANQPPCHSLTPVSSSAEWMHRLGVAAFFAAIASALLLLPIRRRWVVALAIVGGSAFLYFILDGAHGLHCYES
jgi:hypothetical protein